MFSSEVTEAALDENLLPEKMLLGLRLTVGEDQVGARKQSIQRLIIIT